ncbi:hypothetical protein [Streptomyces sp. BV129]|uniref:hypothetical protein n=1 Tax=Streptomyces sp. BV129 TaxID=2849671 RepID=UPI0020C67B15|nr:hypothetical protein [Streptomyces sp. BV129]
MSAGKIHPAALSNFPAWRVPRAVIPADLKNSPRSWASSTSALDMLRNEYDILSDILRGFNWRARLEQPTAKAFVNAAGGAAEYFR